MGAAVEVFPDSRLIEVGRDRFVPVKTTNDLLVLRSDVYDIGSDFVLDQVSVDVPFVDLDGKVYKVVAEFDKRFPEGTPSMRKATSAHRRRRLHLRRPRPGGRRRRARRPTAPNGSPPTPSSRQTRGRDRSRALLGRGAPRAGALRRPAAGAGRRSPPRRARAGLRRGRRRDDVAAELRQLRDGRVRRPQRRRRRAPAPSSRCCCRSWARSAPARPARARWRPGTAAKIMTGAPVPDGRRRDRALRVDRPRRRARSASTRRPSPASTSARPATTSPSGDLLVKAGTAAQRPAHRAARRRWAGRRSLARPRPRVVVLSTGTELRDPGEELGEDSIYDGNSYMLAAAVTRAGGVPHRVGIVRDEPEAFLETLRGTLARRRPRRHLRRRLAGRLRRREGGAAPRGRLVRPGGDAARQAAGVRPRSARTRSRSSRCPATRCRRTSPSRCSCSPRSARCWAWRRSRGRCSRPRLTRGMTSPAGRRQFMRGQVGVDAEGGTSSRWAARART